MKGPLRIQFFKWLMLQTTILFVILAAGLAAFNRHEIDEHGPAAAEEETEEFFVLLGGLATTIPLGLLLSWWISKKLIQPIHHLVETAEVIRAGDLTRRVDIQMPDDELGRLGRAVNDAFDRYHETLERLDRFSYDASHQLRNPLASIRASGETCLSRPRTAGEYQETIGSMLEDAGRLNRTVDQLLTLARLSPRQIAAQFQPVDLSELVRGLAADCAGVCELRGIRCELRLPADAALRVPGVRELLHEAISNLVDNALQATPENGALRFEIERVGDACEIRIGDSGPGLPESAAALARPFRRGEGTGRRDGHGLGLQIVSDIVTAHRGHLTVARSELGGAMFAIRLQSG